MIDFGCPRCGATQRVPDSAAGQKQPCVKCGQRLKVPDAPEMRTMQAVLAPPKVAAVKGAKQWFFEQDGKQHGPVTWPQLKRMATEGDLSIEDRVWGEGMTGWKPAGLISNLFPKQDEAPAAEREGTGKLLEGFGMLVFGVLVGGAILLFVGFLVWRGISKSNEETAEAAKDTASKDQPATDHPLEPKEIFERCSPSVARVLNTSGSGSGFLARPGVVVTNSHVVSDDLASNIQVTFPSVPGGNNPLKATLLHEDRTRDLAILRIETPLKPLPIATGTCPPGEKVVVIGSPGKRPGEVVENSVTDGIWSARTQLDDNQDWYQITANINPGNSGGPVFNSRGQVIGVVTLSLRGKQGMNYAVPHTEVTKALERALARNQRELDQLAAEHDAVVAFSKIGKSSCLYLYAVSFYHTAMTSAIQKGEKPVEGLKRASARIDKAIGVGSGVCFDAECRAALPRVVGNKALPEATRQQMEELLALHAEMKDLFDNPKGTVEGYGKKVEECGDKLKRLFESLRIRLGVNEDPRLTPEELKALNLPL